jgi:hypothetical protein
MRRTPLQTALRAHAIGVGLTDLERIDLGVSLIETVISPDRAVAVAGASCVIREHAEALGAAAIETLNGPSYGKAITHEQSGPFNPIGNSPKADGTAPRAATLSSPGWWRAVRRFHAGLEDSRLGDVLGAIGLFALLAASLFLPVLLS